MRPLLVGGFAGTGKSTVGALLAEKLGVAFVDTDDLVATRAGLPVAEAFVKLGEGAFRALERETLLDALADAEAHGGVIAVGGGALVARAVRHAVLERATVVTLTADVPTLVARVRPATRPLLDAPDMAKRVEELLDARRDVYAEAHFHVDTTGRTPGAVATEIAALAADDSLVVPLGPSTHRYRVVRDAPDALAAEIDSLAPTGVLLVTDATVKRARRAWLERFTRALRAPVAGTVVLAEGEAQKNAASAAVIWDAALGAGVDRRAVVVAFGGGVVGDLAGFAASTLLRGVRWVQAPTSSLAMVDASIGGKTGFDHATGKNRVGTIHQPSAIVADLVHLETLAPRHRDAGLAEVIKIALATDAPFFDALASREAGLDTETLVRAARAKIRVVSIDERESAFGTGARAVLNLGHTVGHAIEAHGRYERFVHGEAVAMGLVAELAATTRLGLTAPGVLEATRQALARYRLPVSAERSLVEAALHHVWSDKKRVGKTVSLPVVHGLGRWSIEQVDLDTLREAVLG